MTDIEGILGVLILESIEYKRNESLKVIQIVRNYLARHENHENPYHPRELSTHECLYFIERGFTVWVGNLPGVHRTKRTYYITRYETELNDNWRELLGKHFVKLNPD